MGRAGEMPWMDASEVRRRENLPENLNLLRNPGSAGKDDGKGNNEKPTQ